MFYFPTERDQVAEQDWRAMTTPPEDQLLPGILIPSGRQMIAEEMRRYDRPDGFTQVEWSRTMAAIDMRYAEINYQRHYPSK